VLPLRILGGRPLYGTFIAMNRKIILLAAVLLAAGCAPQTAPAAPPSPSAAFPIGPDTDFPHIDLGEGLYLRQIQADVFVVTHAFPWPANSLIVEMENNDLVLAGTPYTPEAMQIVLDWIAERFGKRNITAIDPGYHVDNLGGNSALLAAGIPVYGSDLSIRMLAERGEETRQMLLDMLLGPANERYRTAHAAIPYAAPDHVFPAEEGLKLTFGDEQVGVYWPGPTQAPDKMTVFFSGKKVLFGSCMVLGGSAAGNVREADMDNWPKAIEKLKQLGAEWVIPGHGDRLDPGLLDHTIELLAAAG
jgi:metallo-beta-lactamase class B